MLLVLGADPNMLGPGPESLTTTLVTPMISAICQNNLILLELLLLNGGDVFVSDANGWSALQHAVSLKMVQCTSLLLRRGFSAKTAAHLRAKALGILMHFISTFLNIYLYILLLISMTPKRNSRVTK